MSNINLDICQGELHRNSGPLIPRLGCSAAPGAGICLRYPAKCTLGRPTDYLFGQFRHQLTTAKRVHRRFNGPLRPVMSPTLGLLAQLVRAIGTSPPGVLGSPGCLSAKDRLETSTFTVSLFFAGPKITGQRWQQYFGHLDLPRGILCFANLHKSGLAPGIPGTDIFGGLGHFNLLHENIRTNFSFLTQNDGTTCARFRFLVFG